MFVNTQHRSDICDRGCLRDFSPFGGEDHMIVFNILFVVGEFKFFKFFLAQGKRRRFLGVCEPRCAGKKEKISRYHVLVLCSFVCFCSMGIS